MRDYLQRNIVLILTWISVYFAPVIPLVLIMGFMVVCDFITGIAASSKEGTPFNSKDARRSIPKFAAYGVGIMVSHVVQQHFFPDFEALKLIAGLIVFIELKSIDENIKRITGFSLFKAIISKFDSNNGK